MSRHQIDFAALQKQFEQGHKRTEAEKLHGQIARKLNQMVKANRSRVDFLEKLQELIDQYNSGSKNEELAIFDILTKPEPKLSKKEEAEVKKVAKDLLATLKREKLILDWREKQQARAAVRQTIRQRYASLPQAYPIDLRRQKADLTYCHIYDSYKDTGQSIYQYH